MTPSRKKIMNMKSTKYINNFKRERKSTGSLTLAQGNGRNLRMSRN